MVLKYFKTKSGRKVVQLFAGTTAAGLFLINYVPHTFGLDRYRQFIQCYRNGQPTSLSSKLLERLNEASDILKHDSNEKDMIIPFSVYGFNLFSAGSTKSKFGAIIGIPFNYEADSAEEIKSSDICFQGEKVNWNSESGKLLENALVLTKDEQIFGLCKTLLHLQSHHVLMNSVFPSVSFLMVYSVGHYLNLSLNLLARPFTLRLFMYCILSLFGLGSWSFMKDYNQVTSDAEVDTTLASISPELVKAGVGYYEKQLTKNIALREIGKDTSYTTAGNVNYFIRQKSLPLTVRKSFFEKKYKDYSETVN